MGVWAISVAISQQSSAATTTSQVTTVYATASNAVATASNALSTAVVDNTLNVGGKFEGLPTYLW